MDLSREQAEERSRDSSEEGDRGCPGRTVVWGGGKVDGCKSFAGGEVWQQREGQS